MRVRACAWWAYTHVELCVVICVRLKIITTHSIFLPCGWLGVGWRRRGGEEEGWGGRVAVGPSGAPLQQGSLNEEQHAAKGNATPYHQHWRVMQPYGQHTWRAEVAELIQARK